MCCGRHGRKRCRGSSKWAILSSFPLLALDPKQPILLVNCAHCDSIKQFLVGTLYDPRFLETLMACYGQRGVTSPMPFFCKIVAV
jgi:hypothetical protein